MALVAPGTLRLTAVGTPPAPCVMPVSSKTPATEVFGFTCEIFTLPTLTSSRPSDSLVSGSIISSPSANTLNTSPSFTPPPSPRLMVTVSSRFTKTFAGKITSAMCVAIFSAIERDTATIISSLSSPSFTE